MKFQQEGGSPNRRRNTLTGRKEAHFGYQNTTTEPAPADAAEEGEKVRQQALLSIGGRTNVR